LIRWISYASHNFDRVVNFIEAQNARYRRFEKSLFEDEDFANLDVLRVS